MMLLSVQFDQEVLTFYFLYIFHVSAINNGPNSHFPMAKKKWTFEHSDRDPRKWPTIKSDQIRTPKIHFPGESLILVYTWKLHSYLSLPGRILNNHWNLNGIQQKCDVSHVE